MGSTNDYPSNTIEIQEPLKVRGGEAQACPSKTLEPPRNRVKGSAYVPEGNMGGRRCSHCFQMVEHLEYRCMCSMLGPKAMLPGM